MKIFISLVINFFYFCNFSITESSQPDGLPREYIMLAKNARPINALDALNRMQSDKEGHKNRAKEIEAAQAIKLLVSDYSKNSNIEDSIKNFLELEFGCRNATLG